MEIVNKLLVSVIWVIYAIYEGQREAYYYQAISVFNLKRSNIHWIYALQRGLFLVVMGLLLKSIFLPVGLAFIFPFFHDGFYYIRFNILSPMNYKKRFIDQSSTSTAVMEFNWITRLLMFITGIIILTINITICELFGL
jgi:hypothetical protein